MFDLERAIAAWRERLARTGSFLEGDLDELECHLRDHLEALEGRGATGETAFLEATARLGDPCALADEFARAKPLVAWRWPLFWAGAGYFATMVGLALLGVATDVVLWGGTALGLGESTMRALMWSMELGGPALGLPLLALWASRSAGRPLRWADTPSLRVAALLGAAIVVLLEPMDWIGIAIGRLAGPIPRTPAFFAALHAQGLASWVLSMMGPLLAAGFALLFWRRARRRGAEAAHDAAALWLLLGCLGDVASRGLGYVLPRVGVLGGGALQLSPPQMRALMWSIVLAAPALAVVCAVWLGPRLPPPRRLVRSRAVPIAMLSACAASIASFALAGNMIGYARSRLGFDAVVDAFDAALLASLVVAAAAPLVVGVALSRLRGGRSGGSDGASPAAS